MRQLEILRASSASTTARWLSRRCTYGVHPDGRANNIRFFAQYAVERLGEPARILHGGERNRVRYDPSGVVAVSTPWNAPFMLATWRVGPALAAGNTVVLKPPEWAPLTCSLLGDLADEAGVPAGVLNIVHGTGSGPAEALPLTGHPDVDRVAFTGSPATCPHGLR